MLSALSIWPKRIQLPADIVKTSAHAAIQAVTHEQPNSTITDLHKTNMHFHSDTWMQPGATKQIATYASERAKIFDDAAKDIPADMPIHRQRHLFIARALQELGGNSEDTKIFRTALFSCMGRNDVAPQRAVWMYEQVADIVATSKLKPGELQELTDHEHPQKLMAAFSAHAEPMLKSEFADMHQQDLASSLGESTGVMISLMPGSKPLSNITHIRPGPLKILPQERYSDATG